MWKLAADKPNQAHQQVDFHRAAPRGPTVRVSPIHCRSGFTILELLVSISIISVLMSLILPAIQNSRASARRLQCQNNIKNLAVALTGYNTTSNGYYPSVISSRPAALSVWTTEILPQVDAQGVYDRLNRAPAPDLRIPVFVCPDDDANESYVRGLSYVVNVGYGLMTPSCIPPEIHGDTFSFRHPNSALDSALKTFPRADNLDGFELSYLIVSAAVGSSRDQLKRMGIDWNDDGEVTQKEDLITAATGVFWSSHEPTNHTFPIQRLDQGDGTSHTLMVSERAKPRDWAIPPAQGTVDLSVLFRLPYLGPLSSHGFGMGTASFRSSAGEHIMPKFGAWAVRPATTPLQYESIMTHQRYDCPPFNPQNANRVINSPSAYHAAPTSQHIGGVNAAFCDGAVIFLSEDVSPDVFARLLTSGGSRYGQDILSGEYK